jgi:hypothetical protein
MAFLSLSSVGGGGLEQDTVARQAKKRLVSSKIFFPRRFHRFRIKTQMIKANILIGRWVVSVPACYGSSLGSNPASLKNTKWAIEAQRLQHTQARQNI